MEIELAGLQRLTEDEQRLVDAHAERHDEVDWDQFQLANIPEQAELEADDDVVPPPIGRHPRQRGRRGRIPPCCREEKEQLAHSFPCP
jgi:hypothetical protein